MKTTNYRMKTSLIILLVCFLGISLYAQNDSIATDPLEKELNRMDQDESGPLAPDSLSLPQEPNFSSEEKKDTVRIRVGNRAVEIISGDDKTDIDIERIENFESQWEKQKNKKFDHEIDIQEKPRIKKRKKFNGHWGGLEFGGNQLWGSTLLGSEGIQYPTELYPEGTPNFLQTRPEKSFEVNVNLFEYSFGFCSYAGIVTGLGLNFNDYKFKNRYTLSKNANGIIEPIELPEGDFRLSKLSTGYLTAPLMLEFQIPGYNNNQRFFIAGGIIGGVKMGDHTKTKIGEEKSKDKGDHNISPVRWGYIARIGFDDLGIFASYYQTPLFEKGKGPVAYPLTIGLTWSF